MEGEGEAGGEATRTRGGDGGGRRIGWGVGQGEVKGGVLREGRGARAQIVERTN